MSPNSEQMSRWSLRRARTRQGTPTEARRTRNRRSDAGTTLWTDRDVEALTWIGQQYALRLDQLQWVLGRHPGRGAVHTDWISEGSARDVVTRWKRAGWAEAERLRIKEPLWVWPTRLGLHMLGLPYRYRNMTHTSLADLEHLLAINEIRLDLGDEQGGIHWTSERQLLQGITYTKGQALLHRPDAIVQEDQSGGCMAVEAELSPKSVHALAENMLELLRGKEYLNLKSEYSIPMARRMSQDYRSSYTEVWYFAPRAVRQRLRRVRNTLVEQEIMSKQEANRLVIRWYPLVQSDEEVAQEQQEETSSSTPKFVLGQHSRQQ